jgi:hypothetical protein
MNTARIYHQYTVQVIGPKGHYDVKNNKFMDTDKEEAKQQAINRASQIVNSAEFSHIKHFNSFDIIIDYVKTVIFDGQYSFKRGEII